MQITHAHTRARARSRRSRLASIVNYWIIRAYGTPHARANVRRNNNAAPTQQRRRVR